MNKRTKPIRPDRGRSATVWSQEQGAALAFTALMLLALLAMLALAIDLGMLYEARGQAQRTADSAALAGAAALVDFGNASGVEAQAYAYALAYVQENPVQGTVASLEPADVVVDLNAWHVTATVHRTAARGNAVPTLFGRILGINLVDVNALATAEAAEAGAVNCLLPLAMPDRWEDVGSDGEYNEPPDYYLAHPAVGATGYTPDDYGLEIVIKPFKTTGQMNESWYFPWRPPGQQGGADYRYNIANCRDPSLVYEAGSVVDTEPGAMIGPTKQGFGDLIDKDPSAVWDPLQPPNGCVTSGDGVCRGSPRIRPMPMFDPSEAPDPGAKPFVFTNFVNVFVDRLQANEIYAYYMGLAGAGPGGSGSTTGPTVRYVRLIQ